MVRYPLVRLEAPGLDALALRESDGWIGQVLDPGDALTREEVDDAPDADGTLDTTSLTGARAVTYRVTLDPQKWPGSLHSMCRRLRAFTAPHLRPTMFVQWSKDDPEQLVRLRRGPTSAPFDQDAVANMTVQWIAPTGIFESAVLHTTPVPASGAGHEIGRKYNLIYPPDASFWQTVDGEGWLTQDDEPWLTSESPATLAGHRGRFYPPSPVVGEASVVNAGDARVYPIIRLYGPCIGPSFEIPASTAFLSFPDIELLLGQYIQIDVRDKTIVLNGESANSVYDQVDFANLRWPVLMPGVNKARYQPADFAASARAEVDHRDGFL